MNRFKIYMMVATALFAVGCAKIEEDVFDKYAAEEFYASEEGADVALANVYSRIPGNWDGVGYAGADRGYYDINNMSTDEQVIPHRNTGDWELDFARMYLREWMPSDYHLTNAWNWLYGSVFWANLAVEQLTVANADPSKIAEARVVRAWFYLLLIDDFGDVPFFTENSQPVESIPQSSRTEIFNFIESELTTYIPVLPEDKGGAYYGRFNKWAGYAVLAKLYLNAEVYTGNARWEDCLAALDELDKGGFSLHSGAPSTDHPLGNKYFELFGDQCPDDETILAIPITVDIVGRNILTIRSFGGTDGTLLFGYGAWNGAIVPQDFVEKFDASDVRARQFRYGSNPNGPSPAGSINYSLEVDNLDNPGADPNAGARSMKFWPVEPMNSGGASNDFPIYRYADFLLMRAECLVRLGRDGEAAGYVDEVRTRAGLGSVGVPSLDDIYNERGFELAWEAHRRQDMIRFGKFTEAHGLAPAVADYFELFPIPTSAIDANPSLVQNTGY